MDSIVTKFRRHAQMDPTEVVVIEPLTTETKGNSFPDEQLHSHVEDILDEGAELFEDMDPSDFEVTEEDDEELKGIKLELLELLKAHIEEMISEYTVADGELEEDESCPMMDAEESEDDEEEDEEEENVMEPAEGY